MSILENSGNEQREKNNLLNMIAECKMTSNNLTTTTSHVNALQSNLLIPQLFKCHVGHQIDGCSLTQQVSMQMGERTGGKKKKKKQSL